MDKEERSKRLADLVGELERAADNFWLAGEVKGAAGEYIRAVKDSSFPSSEESY